MTHPSIWGAVAPAILVVAGCAEVAGLSDFERAGEAAGNSGAGGQGAGSDGGGGVGTGGSVPCNTDDLVISEIRTEGDFGAKDDLIEIFNPTASPIDLEGYTISARSPTSAVGSDAPRFIGAAGEQIPAYGHLLIAGDSYDDSTPDRIFLNAVSLGNDSLVFLNKDGERLDVACVCADSCGETLWAECDGVLMENAASRVDKDVSVHRIPACIDTDLPADFAPGPSTPMGLESPPTPP